MGPRLPFLFLCWPCLIMSDHVPWDLLCLCMSISFMTLHDRKGLSSKHQMHTIYMGCCQIWPHVSPSRITLRRGFLCRLCMRDSNEYRLGLAVFFPPCSCIPQAPSLWTRWTGWAEESEYALHPQWWKPDREESNNRGTVRSGRTFMSKIDWCILYDAVLRVWWLIYSLGLVWCPLQCLLITETLVRKSSSHLCAVLLSEQIISSKSY